MTIMRALADIRENLDYVGCDNATVLDLCDEIERLRVVENAFRALRAAWFVRTLRSNAHERECEDDEHQQRRIERNLMLVSKYNSQTEEILHGEQWPICPMCEADMDLREGI